MIESTGFKKKKLISQNMVQMFCFGPLNFFEDTSRVAMWE